MKEGSLLLLMTVCLLGCQHAEEAEPAPSAPALTNAQQQQIAGAEVRNYTDYTRCIVYTYLGNNYVKWKQTGTLHRPDLVTNSCKEEEDALRQSYFYAAFGGPNKTGATDADRTATADFAINETRKYTLESISDRFTEFWDDYERRYGVIAGVTGSPTSQGAALTPIDSGESN